MYIVSDKLGFLIILSLIYEANSLVQISIPEENDIITTETIIRKTLNRIFGNLKLIKKTKTINESNTVHNFFTSLTLKDYHTLKNVHKISKVEAHVGNGTNYVGLINEILNENSEDNTTVKEIKNVLPQMDGFLKLIYLYSKEMKANYSIDINAEILKLLNDDSAAGTNSTEDNSLMSDDEFWEPSGRRIYRGQLTKIKYFPFMAVILFFGKFTCAGSIIKSDLIISAASCLQLAYNNRFFRENPSFLSVRVGSTFYNGGGEEIPVMEIYFHPRYDPKNLRHNLCLLRLHRRLKFRRRAKNVKKIDFERTPSGLPMTTDGITVVGWGAQDSSNLIHEPWKNRIAYAILDVYHIQECQHVYSEEYVTRHNFCAGFISKGGGACNHDVGGPGIVNGRLAGVISFGSPVCGTPDAPTVFTKLGFYTDWIEEIMEQDVPHRKRRTTLKHPFTLTLPPPHKPIKTTRFQIPPLGKNIVPARINEADDVNDEKFFRQFLKTMFGSKEVNEYVEKQGERTVDNETVINYYEPKEPKRVTEADIEEEYDGEPKVTRQLYDLKSAATEQPTDRSEIEENYEIPETSREVTEKPGKYTKIDGVLLKREENEIEESIVKLMENIALEKLVDEVSSDEIDRDDDEKSDKKVKNDGSVLTLLYLSDKEKQNSETNDYGGLSIPVKNFNDMTRRNNETEAVNIMPHSNVFELLNEAFEDDENYE